MGLLYEGKAKKIFSIEGAADQVLMEFKDSLTAFNAQKLGSFAGKGALNRDIAAMIFRYLHQQGVKSHFVESVEQIKMITKKVSIIPLEVVVRNRVAGSLAKKLDRTEGEVLKRPLVEFYFKDDKLGDPFVSDDQAEIFGFATRAQMQELKKQALEINSHLLLLFKKVGISLVDFKVEFGVDSEGQVLLADEITPDTCRLWDEKTNEKMDKDRFRRDLGEIDKYYGEVAERIKKAVEA